ncbi:Transmembrane osmosensor [Basidiobolus ranarum]|uniref:Transmembrane osmosensor n=1 Tax=Basidiobolus ranarum TaxID=34480 RepID=A0ABR2WTZ2_9FUNG
MMSGSDPRESNYDPHAVRSDSDNAPDLELHKSPLYIGGLALATLGWIISFVCTIVLGSSGFTWFVVVFTLVLLLMAIAALVTKSVWHYRFPLLTFTAAVLGLLIFQIDDTIYDKTRSIIALGAGSLITAVGLAPWLFLFGRDDNPESSEVVNHQVTTHRQPMVQARTDATIPPVVPVTAPETPTVAPVTSPITPTVAPVTSPVTPTVTVTSPKPVSAPSHSQYPYRAQALYGYEASPDDPNEISFLKDETIDIADTKGKWWQAKKADGSIGIVPSNFFRIV